MADRMPLIHDRGRRFHLRGRRYVSDDRFLFVVAVAVTTALAWARLPVATRDVVWAEDGARFLTELVDEGFWQTLLKPYTGYLQFWPRLLTELAAQAGLERFGVVITVLSCAAVGLIGGGVFVWARAVVAQPVVRLALAAAPVLLPMAPIEVLGNVANLHWFVLWGCAWLLLQRPRTRSGAIGLAALAASFALTEIQVAVLLPLVLHGVRRPRVWIVRTGLLLGLGAQITSTLLAPRASMTDHLGLGSIVVGYFINGPLAAIVGDQSEAGVLLADRGVWIAFAASVPFLVAMVYAVLRGSAAVRVLVGTLLLTSLATWFAALWFNVSSAFTPMFGYAAFTPDEFRSMAYYRYGFVPGLCLVGIVLIAAGVLLDRSRPVLAEAAIARRAGAAVLVGFVTVSALSFTPPRTLRDGQPLWRPSFAAAAAVCAAHPDLTTAQVAQAPATWAADLSCGALR